MNPLNILGGSRRRPTFCRNDEFKRYLLSMETLKTNNIRLFYHYFYWYLAARRIVDQSDNDSIKSATHFKKCLRQAADKLREEMKK